MEIRLNTDNNFTASEAFAAKVNEELNKKLHRFGEYITTAEVFFGDENSGKSGTNDKRCTIEVRPRNMHAEAVTHFADTVDHAFNGAVEKLRNLLDTRIGKLQNR
jgi:hypothetical protein